MTELTSAVGSLDSLWSTIAALMIAVAVVQVGVRFFRKAK